MTEITSQGRVQGGADRVLGSPEEWDWEATWEGYKGERGEEPNGRRFAPQYLWYLASASG